MPELCKKNDCTGCNACYNSCGHDAINMTSDEEGFLFPHIDTDKCVECKLCERSCPVLNPIDTSSHTTKSYAAFASDLKIRKSGSSGGLFTVFANRILSQGGIVAGASFNSDLQVEHTLIESREDLRKLQGSKYVQSDIGLLFKDIRKHLISGKKVLFCGVSCQVAGLLAYLHRPYDNLYTIDLVCHGVPSPKIFKKYINYLKKTKDNITEFSFRNPEGWSAVTSFIRRTKNGKSIKEELFGIDTGYFYMFIKGYMNRECCYNCIYAKYNNRIGDITLADFWGIGKKMPYKHKTNFGVSYVSTNTPKGKKLFDEIKPEIEFEERSVWETINEGNNLQLKQPSKRPEERDVFYKKAYSMDWPELVLSYVLPLRKPMHPIRVALSKIKRTILFWRYR